MVCVFCWGILDNKFLLNLILLNIIFILSFSYLREVEIVIEILLQLLENGYNHITGIGVITPYDA